MKKSKKIIITVACTLACTAAAAAITTAALNKGPFSGTVKDADGLPIADVSVTDGKNVIKTDKNGEFTLKGWRKSDFVTVCVPAGFHTDSFYIPVDKDKKTYDFILEKSELTAKEEYSFLQISDTEIGKDGAGEWLGELKNTVKETNPSFLIHTGDICYTDGLKKHIEQMNTETMGCPVKYVIGNHDYVEGKFGEELYESLYGPVWYSFEVGNVHYAVTSFQTGSDYKSKYNKDDRWRWLENDLKNTAPDKSVIIFNHTKCPSDDFVLSFSGRTLDLKEHNLKAWVYGHYHYNLVENQNGILKISAPRPDCGGIDSSPAGTRIINIKKDGTVTTDMIYYGSKQFTEPENTVWTADLDSYGLFCDTLYEDGNIYTATADDDFPRKCGVYSINAENGNINWFCETENSVMNNIISYENKIIASDAVGNIYSIEKTSGQKELIYSIDLQENLGTSNAIALHGDSLIAGSARKIVSINLKTNTVNWETDRNIGENSPAEFVIFGDKILVSSHWDALIALDFNTGKEIWKNKDADLRFRSSTPNIVNDDVYIAADSGAIMLIDAKTGEITRKTSPEGYNFSSSGQPVITDKTAYIPTAKNGLCAYDIENDEIIWEFTPGEAKVFTPPYVGKGSFIIEATPYLDGKTLIVPCNDGKIYILDITDGSVIKEFNTGSAVLGRAAVTENKIYAVTFDGKAVCFEK